MNEVWAAGIVSPVVRFWSTRGVNAGLRTTFSLNWTTSCRGPAKVADVIRGGVASIEVMTTESLNVRSWLSWSVTVNVTVYVPGALGVKVKVGVVAPATTWPLLATTDQA